MRLIDPIKRCLDTAHHEAGLLLPFLLPLTNALLDKSILTYVECVEIWVTLSNEPSQLSSAPPLMFGSISIPLLAPRDSEEPL